MRIRVIIGMFRFPGTWIRISFKATVIIPAYFRVLKKSIMKIAKVICRHVTTGEVRLDFHDTRFYEVAVVTSVMESMKHLAGRDVTAYDLGYY